MDFIESIKEKNIHIVGICGAETSAIARHLSRSGCTRLTLHDFNTPDDFKKIFDISHIAHPKEERQRILDATLNIDAAKYFKNDYLKNIMDADIIFVGQNWFNYTFNKPALIDAKLKGIPLVTITELYFGLIKAPIIGVTGTNGKTTTANMIRHILERNREAASNSVYFSGNDRYSRQILDDAANIREDDAVVLELSNRQLAPLEASPHIAVITNIARDHIEEHGSFENYINVKRKLFEFQGDSDFAIINHDDDIAKGFADTVRSKVFFYSLRSLPLADCAFLQDDSLYAVAGGKKIRLFTAGDLKLRGEHNISNALAASLAALIRGVSPGIISDAMTDFTGVKSRLEFVREVSGIKFYNDISSTSPHASIAAINSFTEPVIWIGGGMDKDMDFVELCGIVNDRVKSAILLPGTATDRISELLTNYSGVSDLHEAVKVAYDTAAAGDVVVLSPAAANFFTLYASGKNGYNRIVKKLRRK